MTKKTKTKVKYRYRNPKDYDELKAKASSERQNDSLKKEIIDLEKKRSEVPKGFKGVVQKAAINKEINERRKFMRGERNLVRMDRKNIQMKKQVAYEKTKEELLSLRKKNAVNFEDLGGTNFGSGNKQVKYEDLFK